jgi:hypothetical protein
MPTPLSALYRVKHGTGMGLPAPRHGGGDVAGGYAYAPPYGMTSRAVVTKFYACLRCALGVRVPHE